MSESSINLEGAVNIAKVESLHHEMEEAFKLALPTIIHASDVSRADTAALQLLVVFIKSMHQAKVKISWSGVSDELVAAAKLLGLEEVLNLPIPQ